jgi:hypothetical protein
MGENALTLDTEHFRLHYTLEGRHQVAAQDLNGNDHPDYVDQLARAFEYSWYAEIEYFGWAAPPPDANLGGDAKYDIYIQDLDSQDLAGYASIEDDPRYGDNPNTTAEETTATSSYIVMENDYLSSDYIVSTAAHELMHAIQFGLDGKERSDWLSEATATWMEDEVYDLFDDPIYWLDSVFKSTDSCQIAEGGDERVEDTDRWYGMWIFMRYLSESYGHEAVRDFWELAVTHNGYEIWDALFVEYRTNLEGFFAQYSVALLARDFEDGQEYPTVRLEGIAYLDELFEPVDGVAKLGADYVEISAAGTVKVSLNIGGGANLLMDGLVVGIRGDRSETYRLGAVVDLSSYDHTYLIIMNYGRPLTESSCKFEPYSALVSAINERPGDPAWTGSAVNFAPPSVEGLIDPDDR